MRRQLNQLRNDIQPEINQWLIAVLLTAAIAAMNYSCRTLVYQKEQEDKIEVIMEILQKEAPEQDMVTIYNPDIIKLLYEKSEKLLSMVWEKRGNIDQMIFAIRNVSADGLNPEDYHLEHIEKLVRKIIFSEEATIEDVSMLELLLTDSFLLLTAHLAGGKTSSETIDPQWMASKRLVRPDMLKFIDSTLQKSSILEGLQHLTPKHREYLNLKMALAKYRQISQKGGWKSFGTLLPKIEKGMRHADVALLRNRLAVTQGPIESNPGEEDLFDQTLFESVLLFQVRNGLTADGIVGKATIEALNIPIKERIASIKANLERWRWLSNDLGNRYIKVNIANFELQVIENDKMVFMTSAIVGKAYRETPVFSSVMTYLVFNPNWTVPPTILKEDIIPSVIANPDYLKKKGLKILKNDGTEVDPSSIDWNSIKVNGFPYMINQAPGPGNALGKVKFMFPNKYSVYIHDTPDHNLFNRTDRLFSSGCIRVNDPLELAALLLKENPSWNAGQIENSIGKGKQQTVYLPLPINVHIVYLTAWASDDGVVYFRKDVYNRDPPLLAALRQEPPANRF